MADGSSHRAAAIIVSPGQVTPDPLQPRKHFDTAALATLADSIREHGLLQPIVVRPTPAAADGSLHICPYMIIAGERRWRASVAAGVEELPAILRSDLSEAQVRVLQLTENLEREDLSLPEKCAHITSLVDLIGFDETVATTKRSEAWVSKHNRLLKLPGKVYELVVDGLITSVDIAHDLATLIELKGSSWRVDEAIDDASKGSLTRAAMRDYLDQAHREAQRRKDEAAAAEARAQSGQQTLLEQVAGGTRNFDTLSHEVLQKLQEEIDELDEAPAGVDIEGLQDKINERSEELRREEKEEKRESAARDATLARLRKLKADLLPEQVRLTKLLYQALGIPMPANATEEELFGEGGVLVNDDIDNSHELPACIASELPSEYTLSWTNKLVPKKLDDCEVSLHITFPLSRLRQLIEGLAPARPAKPAKPATEQGEETDIEWFLRINVDRSDEGAKLKGAMLFERYERWCKSEKLKPLSGNNLALALEAQGIERKRLNIGVHYLGCKLKPAPKKQGKAS
ncbi:ParB/RepB/Spo0J family partition protein [Hydrocarboniphaga sp.]|uniref:ParB/RepB/Spo0J family partition protein n=1 Tax=Hydrocarboniphaga sp. TaxID=2033016 RepID=UPI003D0C49FB